MNQRGISNTILIIIFFVLLVGISAGGYYIYNNYIKKQPEETKQEPQKSKENTEEQLVEDLKRKAKIAEEKAKQWDESVYLYMLDVPGERIEPELQDETLIGVNLQEVYTFGFINIKGTEVCFVCVNRTTDAIEFSGKRVSDPGLDYTSVFIDRIGISHKKAQEIADKNGAKEFKNKYPDYHSIGPTLTYTKEYSLNWLVVYYYKSSSGTNRITFVINAITGEIIKSHEK